MPLPTDAGVGARRLLRDESYGRLRRLIVDGTLEPGERLRDADLARWLGVSRTPVREALSRLVDDGLVEMAPNRFTRVTPISTGRAREAHRAMAVLEGELLAAGAPHAATMESLRADAERFSWALWRADRNEALAADQALHDALRDGDGGFLAGLIERVEPIARRAQMAAWPLIAGRWPFEAHTQLLDGVQRGDGATARAAAAAEWRALAELVGEVLADR